MIEIRIHGRGGQGVKKAAQILARAGFLSGFMTQDFAMYGAERRGAPVTSFVRLDRDKIMTRGHIFEPDYIIILDNSLDLKLCLTGKKKTTITLIDSKYQMLDFHNVDATLISMKVLGAQIPNNVLLGAFVKLFRKISLNNLQKAIEVELGKYSTDIIEKNKKAAEIGYKGCV